MQMATNLGAKGIISLTTTGFTSRLVSKHRPECLILAITESSLAARRLAMNWGIVPLLCPPDLADREKIAYAIGAHHEDLPQQSVLDVLVQSADALSGARPGARKEMLQSYVKRLEDLEAIANTFGGVEKSYAIQAGRELRIIVDSGKIGDSDALLMSQDIAKSIEEKLTYPGQIRVTVIRETRAVEFAK